MLAHLTDVSVRSLLLALPAAFAVWKRTAALQHAIWTAVLCGMLTLFAFGQALPRFPMRVLDSPPPTQFEEPVETSTGNVEQAIVSPAMPLPPRVPARIDWSALVTYLYAAIAFAFLVRFMTGMFLIRKLRSTAVPIPCTGPDHQYESDHITVPVTIGWLRPRILLPQEWRTWSPDKLEAVLAHEGAHASRHDGVIAALAHMNRCIFWFHPLAWILERRLAMLAEQACDESVVAQTGDRNGYANILLEMASVVDVSAGRMRHHALTMAAASHIRQRIDRVLQEGRTFSRGLTWAGWTGVLLCGIPLVLCAGAVDLAHQPALANLELPRWNIPVPLLSELLEQNPKQPESAPPPVMLAQTAAPAPPAIAQHVEPGCNPATCTFNLTFRAGEPQLANITGAPYSARFQNADLRTLPNGTHMSIQSSPYGPTTYRDSKGRVRSERHALENPNNPPDDFIIAVIYDPVAGFEYVLDPVNRVAHRRPFKPESSSKWDPSQVTNMQSQPRNLPGPNATVEFLGTRTISGVLAYGEKTTFTRTAPNGNVFTQSREQWFDPVNGVALLTTTSSPQDTANIGTMTQANYSNAEPAPELFEVPAGYQTVDEPSLSFAVVHPRLGPVRNSVGTATLLPRLAISRCNEGTCNITFDPGNGPLNAWTGAPYSGHETPVSSLSNQPPIIGAPRGHFRDSQGRLRTDPAQFSGRGPGATSRTQSLVEIEDAVAGYIYIINPASQTAYRVKATFRPAEFPQDTNMAQQPGTRTTPDGRTDIIENLAPQIISGVTATGQRYTTTYPPGTFNSNDKEIVTVNERWIDPKTGVVVLTKNTGLMGNGTISIPDYKEGDPDPSLFQIPAGYKIVDETGTFTFAVPTP